MLKTFLQNALFQVSLNLLVKGVYLFAIDRAVQNLLPEGDYGLYFSLLGLGMLLQVIADFGLQLHNAKELSGERERLAHYFPYFIGLKLILGTAFFLVLLAVGYGLGYRGGEILLLVLAGAVQFFNSVVLYLRSNLSGLGWYRLDGWFSVLDKSLLILSVGGLLLLAPEWLTITRFAALQLTAWGVTATLLLSVLWGKLPRKLPAFRRTEFAALLRGGAPFALAVFLATAYTRTDAVMIERLLANGAEEAGHYAAGYRLLDALNMAGWLLAGLLIPMYARLRATGESIRPLLAFSVPLLLVGAAIAAIPLALTAGPVTELLYDFADGRTADILFWLALTFIAQSLNYAYGSLLSAAGMIGRMNWIYAAGIVINLGGNYLVLPRFGAAGAAMVTLGTQGFIAVVQTVFTHRWLKISYATVAWGRALLFIFFHGTCVLAQIWLGWPYYVVLGVSVTGGLLAAVGTGLVDVRGAWRMVGER